MKKGTPIKLNYGVKEYLPNLREADGEFFKFEKYEGQQTLVITDFNDKEFKISLGDYNKEFSQTFIDANDRLSVLKEHIENYNREKNFIESFLNKSQ